MFSTLEGLMAALKRTFGDPDQERTAYAQLHALKMTMGMTADKYMAKFEMLMGRTGFNEAALEDAFIRGSLSCSCTRFTPKPRCHLG